MCVVDFFSISEAMKHSFTAKSNWHSMLWWNFMVLRIFWTITFCAIIFCKFVVFYSFHHQYLPIRCFEYGNKIVNQVCASCLFISYSFFQSHLNGFNLNSLYTYTNLNPVQALPCEELFPKYKNTSMYLCVTFCISIQWILVDRIVEKK